MPRSKGQLTQRDEKMLLAGYVAGQKASDLPFEKVLPTLKLALTKAMVALPSWRGVTGDAPLPKPEVSR